MKEIKFWLGFFPFSCSFVIKQLRSEDLKKLRQENKTLTFPFCDFDQGEKP